jgi:hypothetical protein
MSFRSEPEIDEKKPAKAVQDFLTVYFNPDFAFKQHFIR